MGQVLHKRNALLVGDFRHHTVVHDAQPSIGHHHEVTRMRIGVQETRLQKLHHVRVEQLAHHLSFELHPGLRGVLLELRQFGPIHPFLDEHVGGGDLAKNARHLDHAAHHLHFAHLFLEAGPVVRLLHVVQLLQEPLRRHVQNRQEALRVLSDLFDGVRLAREVAEEVGEVAEREQVQGDVLEDVRSLTLHGNLRAIQQGCLVHLSYGRRCHALVESSDVAKHFPQRLAQLAL
mmetsp:Transcript_40348/g.77116  ORF Transcript_40348/g.77116 Transcript_40348/m.77116 type:complete len:233 (+) Transcript_40348:1322-2020(+)